MKYFLFLLLFISCGCAHLASNTPACENAGPMLPLPWSFVGNVFQVGPCASIEPLRIEVGVELRGLRSMVEDAIDKKQMNWSVEQYSRKMGCDDSSFDHFLKVLIENKGSIFGKNSENSDRVAVRETRKITKEDPILLKSCWR